MGKVGRPTKRTPEVEEIILDGLAAGITLQTLCDEPAMPSPATVRRWKREDEKFRTAYARAREDGAEAIVDRMFDRSEDLLTADSRVQVDAFREYRETVKWTAARHNAQYGDKQKHEHTGEGGKPLSVVIERASPDGG